MALDAPAGGDLPSWDDLPDSDAGGSNQAPQQSADSPPPQWNDLPSWDDLPDQATNKERPAPEGTLKTGLRAAASGVIPGFGGLAGMGAGAEAGSVLGTFVAPGIGTVIGGVGGAIAGAFGGAAAAGKVQDVGKEALGLDDSTQQAVNAEEHPIASTVGNLAGNMVGFNPAKAATIGARAVGAGVMGAIETGRQAVSSEDWDPTKIALNVAAGALAPNTNRLGAAVEGAGRGAARKFVPGRPNVEPRPEDDQARADAGQGQAPSVARGGVTEQSPVRSTETTGNPQSAPTRSNRLYGKAKKFLGGEDTLTTGDMDPATAEALTPEESWLNTSGPRVPRPGPDNPGEELPIKTGIAEAAAQQIENVKYTTGPNSGFTKEPADPARMLPAAQRTVRELGAKKNLDSYDQERLNIAQALLTQLREQPVDTGLVQAAGGNANKPVLTLSRPKATQEAIAASQAKQPLHPKTAAVAEAAQDAHPEPTPAQIEAGNQKKGHERFAGKAISIENAEGSIRKSKPGFEPPWEVQMPYHYGDVKGTRGADKDPIDIAFDPQGGENHYVVDQKNAETGKFDEHKVFAHTTTPDRVRDLYNAGFSDDRGPERLGAVTKVSEDELSKWFKNPAIKTKPFSKTFEEGIQRPVAEEAAPVAPAEEQPYKLPPVQGAVPLVPKVVTATVKKLRESANPEHAKIADTIESMSGKEQALAAAKADVMLKTGKVPENLAIARLRPTKDNLKAQIGDEVVEARSKADLARKVDAYNGLKEAFDKHAPAETETPEQTRSRAEALAADTTKHLLAYRPNVKPAEYMLARSAKQLANKKISVNKFIADEQLLRSGDKDAITQVRQGNRIEADIGRSQRPTVEQAEQRGAVAQAEAESAPHESATFEHIKTREDIPGETGKALDITKPEDHAEITDALDIAATPKENWKDVVGKQQEDAAAKMQRQREARLAAEKAGSKPAVKTPEWITAHAKEVEAEAKTEASKKEAKARSNLTSVDLHKKGRVRDLLSKFVDDEGGSVDIDQIKKSLMGEKGAKRETLDLTGDHVFGPEPAKKPKSDYWTKQSHETYRAKTLNTPQEKAAQSIDDKFNILRKSDTRDIHDMLSWEKSLPDALFDRKGGVTPSDERIFFARDEKRLNSLSPEEQALVQKHYAPEWALNDELMARIRKLDPDALGPDVEEHISHITKGSTPEYNILKHSDDPLNEHFGAVSTRLQGPLLARKFGVLEHDTTGDRAVIYPRKDGFTIMKDGNRQRVKDKNFKFKVGDKYHVDNIAGGRDTYTMREATVNEKETHARFENGKKLSYYHSGAMATAYAQKYLRQTLRHLEFVDDLKKEIQELKLGAPRGAEMPDNWRKTNLPNFDGWKFDPHLADVLDDKAMAGFQDTGLGRVRRWATNIVRTLFWLPTAHINNEGTHAFVGRGARWASIPAYKRLATTSFESLKSIINQDQFQRDLDKHGASTILSSLPADLTSNGFMDSLAKGARLAIEAQPWRWDPIARQFGLGPSDLVKALYRVSARTLWGSHDFFLTQGVKERMAEGLSMEQAIIETERHLPNYRIPARVLSSGEGGRLVAQALKEKALFAFGPYHYGVFNSYANIMKDAVKGNGAAKLEAVGNVMAMGILAFGIYPLMDMAARKITGNEDASQQRRGPLTIPAHLNAARKGEEDFASFARSTFTLSPMLATALQTLAGKDYRGKNIIEPGDLRSAGQGSLPAAARAGVQGADFLARGLISPYSTLSNTIHKKESPGEGVRDQALDQKNPSAEARKYLRNVPKRSQQEAISRFKKPAGLGEDMLKKLGVPFR